MGLSLSNLPSTARENVPDDNAVSYGFRVVEILPHLTGSYTQGFFFHQGSFYESTGQYGHSVMARVDVRSGRFLQSHALKADFFGEGACLLNGCIYQLTWQENTCFVYDLATLKVVGSLPYTGEGWGLATDGQSIIMSDGSSTLTFRDPATLMPQRSITVTMNGKPVDLLNELEFIEGEVWANIYGSDRVVRINPADGTVTGYIDFKNLLPASLRKPTTDVLNGIAYDPVKKHIWVTGKNWPKVYRVEIK